MPDAPIIEATPNTVAPVTPTTHAARVAEAARTLAAARAGKGKVADPVVAEKATTDGVVPPVADLQSLAGEDKTAKVPIIEDPKPPEPKPDELTPKLAAIAREDARIQKANATLKAKETELAEREAKIGTGDAFRQRFASDIAGLAEELKLTPEQRKSLANELFYSGVPKEQWPADRAGKASESRILSEVEQAKARAEAAEKAFKDFEAKSIREREQAETDRAAADWTGKVAAAVSDSAPLVQAMLSSDPKQTRIELWNLSVHMARDLPQDQELTEAQVIARAEELLSARFAPIRAVYTKTVTPVTPVPPAAAKVEQPPNTLTNQRTASPSRAEDTPKKSMKDLQAEAERKLREARAKG